MKKQASSTHITCWIYWSFFKLNQKNLLGDQISEYNKKLTATLNQYDTLHDKASPTPTAPQLPNFHKNYYSFLVSRNYKITAKTLRISPSHSYPHSPVSQAVVHQPNFDDT